MKSNEITFSNCFLLVFRLVDPVSYAHQEGNVSIKWHFLARYVYYRISNPGKNFAWSNRNINWGQLLVSLGGAVVSWLERSTPDLALRVQALTGDIVLCSWARLVLLSAQLYKWILTNSVFGVSCEGSRGWGVGVSNNPSIVMSQKLEISASLIGHMA